MKFRKTTLINIGFFINVVLLIFAPWYFTLPFTLIMMTLFKHYKYLVILVFPIIEIGVFSYFSLYNITLIYFLFLVIFDLIKSRKINFLGSVPNIYYVLLIVASFGFLNFLYFFPYTNIFGQANLINGLIIISKLIFIVLLYVDLSINRSNQFYRFLDSLKSVSKYIIILIFIYFLYSSDTFSSYQRYVISGMDPNDFGSRLVVFSILAIMLPVRENVFRRISSDLIIFGFTSLIILMTGSRTALLALVISFMFYIIFSKYTLKFRFLSFAVLITGLVALLTYTDIGINIVQRTLYSDVSDISTGRFNIWSTLIRYTIQNRPLFGFGLGKYVPATINLVDHGIPSFDHNIFVSVFTTLGVIGLVVYIIFILAPIKGLLFTKRNTYSTAIYVSSIVAVISGLFLVWAFEDTLLILVTLSGYSLRMSKMGFD